MSAEALRGCSGVPTGGNHQGKLSFLAGAGGGNPSFPLGLRVWGTQEGELRSSLCLRGDASWLLWAQSLGKEKLGPLWGSEEENWGAGSSEGEVRITSESQRGSRIPPTFTGGTSRVLAGVQRQEAGDLLEFRKRGVGGSPWPFREQTREGLP